MIGSQSILQKCDLFRGHLTAIKESLYDSGLTQFNCAINEEDTSQFNNQSALIEHIRQIVSICDSSRKYFFSIDPINTTDSNVAGIMIASILEMPVIARSSDVAISLDEKYSGLTQFPVETISNWLNQERQAVNQNQGKRRFFLNYPIDSSNVQEMCDFLKQVFFIFPNIYVVFFICNLIK